MKTKRLRTHIITYLRENGAKSTTEIKDHLNQRTRHGTTMNQLGNILAKCSEFRKLEEPAMVSSVTHSGYKVCVGELDE